jgi:tetratricopeptide (TPR) repeat protein
LADVEAALKYFELALEKDPNYALAYTGIVRVWGSRQGLGLVSPHEARPRMKAAAQKAIELDSTLAEAHHRLASIMTWGEWDWKGGEAAYRRVIELKPNYPAARRGYSFLLMILGRPDEAMVQIERALELDPLNELFQGLHGAQLLLAERYDEAIVQLQHALKTAPNSPELHGYLRDAFMAQEMYDEALAEWKALFFTPGERGLPEIMERGYVEGGFREAARRTAETWAARSDTIYVPPNGVAALFAAAGEDDRALDWLERGLDIHNPQMPGIAVAPIFDSLRNNRRFQDLLRRMNLPSRAEN